MHSPRSAFQVTSKYPSHAESSRRCHGPTVASCSGRLQTWIAWLGPVGVHRDIRAPGWSANPPSWLTVVGSATDSAMYPTRLGRTQLGAVQW